MTPGTGSAEAGRTRNAAAGVIERTDAGTRTAHLPPLYRRLRQSRHHVLR